MLIVRPIPYVHILGPVNTAANAMQDIQALIFVLLLIIVYQGVQIVRKTLLVYIQALALISAHVILDTLA